METERGPSELDFSTLRSAMPHPLGTRARVLLASVFGPYAQDDEYGSRLINPMELYHNQVTRVEGPFSLRMFHRSWGLMLIQANIAAPCTLLDFPTQDRFIEEIRDRRYDVVGISSITTNVLKVKRMCELVRQYQPAAVIVVGGHVANIPDLHKRVDADWIVRGEGVEWFRRFLGEDPTQPIRHPVIPTRIGTRNMGISVKEKPTNVAATLIPSVGCPVGCNFCATSAMFGGKGKWIDFYRTGDELFDIMCQIEQSLANPIILRDGRELSLPSPPSAAVVGTDGATRQVVDAVCVQLGRRAQVVCDRATRRLGRLLGLDGIGGREQPIREARRH